MEVLDVRNITEIPDIESYLSRTFSLVCYDRYENIQIWEQYLDPLNAFTIEIISEESLINPHEELADLIAQDNIDYFCFNICKGPEYNCKIVTRYQFRPGIEEHHKNYYKG
jgi:hypothetical protein